MDAQPRQTSKADAFTEIVEPHYPGLVRRLTVVLGDREAALDAAQEAYLRAYRAWDRFDGRDARAWLHTIGLRLAFNERDRRRRWFGRGQPSRDVAATPQTADTDLQEALRGLRREHRAVLLLNIVDGYTHAEIATMLQVPAGTVAGWVSRAKGHLRKALGDD